MIFKVHWIIDGVAEIDAQDKKEAEKILQEGLENYVKNSDVLMNKFVAKSIQGTAYKPGNEDSTNNEKENSTETKEDSDEDNP
tara:strand:- start:4176 stop:4424 length:249 start_codon:yes stop_codon:yes gene_type:complete